MLAGSKTLENIVVIDPEILGGAYPVFVGTRVPVQNLISHLKGGRSIDDFLIGFPSVRRDQVLAVLDYLGEVFKLPKAS
jgi:uncharacterized protein (DUF433 family)